MSILCVQLLSGMLYLEPARAAAVEYSEDAVKAAYLYRFAGYVDWPGVADASKPFVIAVVDAPAVVRELKRLVPGHPINNRIVVVVEASRIKDAGRPAILFIGGGHADLLAVAVRVFGGGRQSRDARGLEPECGLWNECTPSSELGPS